MKQFLAGLLLVTATLGSFANPSSSHSQQPVHDIWAVVPNGVFADPRLQDAFGRLAANDPRLNEMLRYADDNPSRRQVTPPLEDAKVLMAAAGFNVPSVQLVETRRCRIWLADGADSALVLALGKALAFGAAAIGVQMQPCEETAALAEADFVIWPIAQKPPIDRTRQGLPDNNTKSFLREVRNTSIPAPAVVPPRTGDAGLISQEPSTSGTCLSGCSS